MLARRAARRAGGGAGRADRAGRPPPGGDGRPPGRGRAGRASTLRRFTRGVRRTDRGHPARRPARAVSPPGPGSGRPRPVGAAPGRPLVDRDGPHGRRTALAGGSGGPQRPPAGGHADPAPVGRAAAWRRPRGGATGAVPRAARRTPGGPRRVPRRAGPEWLRRPDRPRRPHLHRAPPGRPQRAPGSRPIRRGGRRPRRRVGGQPGGRAPPRRGVGRRGPGRRAVRRGPRVARGRADARGADHRRTGPLGNRLVATPLQRTGPTWPPLARGGRRRDPGRAHRGRTGGSGLPAGAGPRTRPAASHHPSAQRRLDAHGQRSAPDRIHQPGSDGQRSRSRRGSPLDAGRARRPRPSARRARRLLPFRPGAAPRAGAARPPRPLRRAPAPPPGRPLRRHRSGSLPYRFGRVGWVGPAPDRGAPAAAGRRPTGGGAAAGGRVGRGAPPALPHRPRRGRRGRHGRDRSAPHRRRERAPRGPRRRRRLRRPGDLRRPGRRRGPGDRHRGHGRAGRGPGHGGVGGGLGRERSLGAGLSDGAAHGTTATGSPCRTPSPGRRRRRGWPRRG